MRDVSFRIGRVVVAIDRAFADGGCIQLGSPLEVAGGILPPLIVESWFEGVTTETVGAAIQVWRGRVVLAQAVANHHGLPFDARCVLRLALPPVTLTVGGLHEFRVYAENSRGESAKASTSITFHIV